MIKGLFKSSKFKICVAVAITIFSLASVFSGTIAWFQTQKSVSVQAGSFQVVGPESKEYKLYYLSSFTDPESHTQPGNYNPTIGTFLGYEVEYQNATFAEIELESEESESSSSSEESSSTSQAEGLNPTRVQDLWPAHKLTFAIVADSASGISLSSFSETYSVDAKVSATQPVSLSWAINIYGNGYNVSNTGNDLADITSAFSTHYYSSQKNDVMDFYYTSAEQKKLVPSPWVSLPIVSNISEPAEGQHTVIFFTIEFSNDSSTFFSYDSSTTYYEKNTSGNSNCYEKLKMQNLVFSLV